MWCNFLLIQNLPYGITSEDLVRALIGTFPDEFEMPFIQQTLHATVFNGVNKRGHNTVRAVVGGLVVEYDDLVRKAAMRQINGRFWVFKQDFGDPRLPNGDFQNPLDPGRRRVRGHMDGKLLHKVKIVINTSVVEKLGNGVWNYSAEVYFRGRDVKEEDLARAGTLLSAIRFKGVTKATYCTSIEALQAILYLNGHLGYRVCDENGKILCNHFPLSGLGKPGTDQRCFVDINFWNRAFGYIPFEAKNQKLFNNLIINEEKVMSLRSFCWKCKSSFKILGFEPSFRYLAGKCYCTYSPALDVTSKERAFFWKSENFTRLLPGSSVEPGVDLIIMHEYMKLNYANPKEYQNIVQPQIMEEWKYTSREFKRANQRHGRIKNAYLVDTFENKKGVETNLFSVSMELDSDSFWCSENFSKIGKLTLNFDAETKGRLQQCKRKATLSRIVHSGNQSVLFVRLTLDTDVKILCGKRVHIVPKPHKTEYNNCKDFMKLWGKSESEYPLLKVFLNPNADVKFGGNHADFVRSGNGMHRATAMRIRQRLNEKQKEGLDAALNTPLSIIQGPPGTGKTFLGANIAVSCCLKEKGNVVVTAGSNYAVDGIVEKISQNAPVNPNIRILRIYSKSREAQYEINGTTLDFGNNVDVLHQQVRASEKYLNGEKYQEIRRKLAEKRFDLLKVTEWEIYEQHIARLEFSIMKSYHVFAATVNSLSDHRLLSFSSPDKIGTILIDEAGQLTQMNTLPLFKFKSRRMIFLGDNKQLRAQITSISAEIAGLPLSVMDWQSLWKSRVPWTMLTVQHRTNPINRSIVSSLCYDGKLVDSDSVVNEPDWVRKLRLNLLSTSLSSPVVVFNHQGSEAKDGFSFYNPTEIDIIDVLCEKLIQFLPPRDITVLSLYEAQRNRLASRLADRKIEAKNVDAFQGRENRIIVLSMVRGRTNDIGFAANINRINVAISRAKNLLFVICNIATFARSTGTGVVLLLKELAEKADVREGALLVN